MTLPSITKPTMMLDEQKCRANISRMAGKAKEHNVSLRPHFKTHQSLEVGRWFKDHGVNGITVSSSDMALYFSREWKDITLAFPLNHRELEKINALSEAIKLNVMVDSVESADYLSRKSSSPMGCFLEIDTGYHRTGIDPRSIDKLEKIISCLEDSENLNFKGFLTHDGQTYTAEGTDSVLRLHEEAKNTLLNLKSGFIERYPELQLSIGDTPGCSLSNNFEGIDEIRPGNFVFYDLVQHAIGACKIEDIAVCMVCPVVGVYPEREELVIYGGAVHFSKDHIRGEEGKAIFGQVVEQQIDGWDKAIPGMQLIKVSQELGAVSYPKHMHGRYKVGDLVSILPVHSCLTANLQAAYTLLNGDTLLTLNSIPF